MNQTAIRVEHLSKRYRIGRRERYRALRDVLTERISAPFRARKKSSARSSAASDYIWALQDVSFEVQRGDVVGIIGANGAGKSTLLKILTRITEPTSGSAEIHGRVGPLLEVGTGFHAELTGRENVYLNGAILGMRKKEIDRKFDEIVAFAEVEKFMDTPVKHFSSGMYVRLAFAVAAHLEPEILLVDEVLAVGDVSFQKKCLGKMEGVAKQGRTVFFVSHNMQAVERLCTRAILLEQGKVAAMGSPNEVISTYLQSGLEKEGQRVWPNPQAAPGDQAVRLNAIRVCDAQGQVSSQFSIRSSINVEVDFWVLEAGHRLDVHLYFYDSMGTLVMVAMDNQDDQWQGRPRPTGWYRSRCRIPADFWNNRVYTVLLGITSQPYVVHLIERDIISFKMVDDMQEGGARSNYTREWPDAVIRPILPWDTEFRPMDETLSAPAPLPLGAPTS